MVPLPLGFENRSDHIPAGTNLRGEVSRQTGLAVKPMPSSPVLSIATSADDNHSVLLVGGGASYARTFFLASSTWPTGFESSIVRSVGLLERVGAEIEKGGGSKATKIE